MTKTYFLLCLFCCMNLTATPPEQIPPELYDDFTLNGQIPVSSWYMDDSYHPSAPVIWKKEVVDKYIEDANQQIEKYYGKTDKYLYDILNKHEHLIKGKSVCVLGSVTPWYECIVLAYGGHPTTVEYNKIKSKHRQLKVMTVEEYEANPIKFDAVISISSIEHDGLGRYGDPINPFGDFEAMAKIQKMLNPEGILILAVPVGQDLLVWNAHRIYGPIRLPLLLQGWDILDSSGFSEKDFQTSLEKYEPETHHQPVFLMIAKTPISTSNRS